MTTSPIRTTEDKGIAGMNKVIVLNSVGKRYPLAKTARREIDYDFQEFWALKDVLLDVYEGEVLGIIGRNGAGKTTLLNILAGVLSPTQGEVVIKGKILGLFNLGVGFQDELTGRENIFLNGAIVGATRAELEGKLNAIIEFSELGNFINMPLGTYSQGMRLRLAFSIIANLDFDILVIDEVLTVGDALFQGKCFQRLMDFRRSGRTLIITTQGMDLIERLCDRIALLDHGSLLFQGNTLEGINRYRSLLHTEKFFVGPEKQKACLVENTKKWADDISSWGQKLGTKEAEIDSVEFINKFGFKCNRIKSGDSLKIKVYFTAKDNIKDPHFGVAIFRNDGVYCYGPNSEFDGYKIPEIKAGRGGFALDYRQILLAPGEYRVSVAIWDKNETLAFDYHNGCHKLIIQGPANTNGLLRMPFKVYPKNFLNFRRSDINVDLNTLIDKGGKRIETEQVIIESVKFLNHLDEEKAVFKTNEPVKLLINFSKLINYSKNAYLWIGLYRDDGVYCQGITQRLGKGKDFKLVFPKLPLLPGGYRISLGIWDSLLRRFLFCQYALYPFHMIFNHQDHGTVFLEHKWALSTKEMRIK